MRYVQKVFAKHKPFEILNYSGTLYHGSTKPVKKFEIGVGRGRYGSGLYLTPDLKTAQFYAAGGRQGNAGQKLSKKGYIYEFKVKGSALKVLNEQETMREVISDLDEASDAFQQVGDLLSNRVTKYLGKWANEEHNAEIIWLASDDMGVLSPLPQVLVTNKSVIKSYKALD